jgi:hypothetical protein
MFDWENAEKITVDDVPQEIVDISIAAFRRAGVTTGFIGMEWRRDKTHFAARLGELYTANKFPK